MLPVLAGIEGVELTPEERELFTRLQPAGYILFSRNIVDYELTRELTDELRRLTTGPDEPIIAIDQEGGRVVRTAAIGVQLPSAEALAATDSEHRIRQAAYLTARGLQALGVNTDLAPVLDLGSAHANALPGRCWGSEPQSVISKAGVWNRALAEAGVLSCGKHFPGMGAATSDPHVSLPVLHGTRESFLREATLPFLALMPELPSLMIAHLRLADWDESLPTSLSPALIRDFLRLQLGYEGLVLTDDLCMGAIAQDFRPEESTVLALRAGADLPLICHRAVDCLESVAGAVSALPREQLADTEERLARFRLMIHTPPPFSFIQWNDYLKAVDEFARQVPELPRGPLPDSAVQHY